MTLRSEALYRGADQDPYADHQLFYDIIDLAVYLRMETLKLSKVVDPSYTLTNSQQGLLGMIYRYEGATQAELARLYQRDPKNLIRGVTELVDRGLVTKRPQDGKAKGICLTAEGRAVNDGLMAARGALIDEILSRVSRETLSEVRGQLERIGEIMEQVLGEDFG